MTARVRQFYSGWIVFGIMETELGCSGRFVSRGVECRCAIGGAADLQLLLAVGNDDLTTGTLDGRWGTISKVLSRVGGALALNVGGPKSGSDGGGD